MSKCLSVIIVSNLKLLQSKKEYSYRNCIEKVKKHKTETKYDPTTTKKFIILLVKKAVNGPAAN